MVRTFAPFITTIVKKFYEALELEDLVIDLDLNHHSQQKQAAYSKKRKLQETSLSTIADSFQDESQTSFADQGVHT